MRTPRRKVRGAAALYHCMSRIGGEVDDYPLTDVDKERYLRIVQEAARLFLIEPISICCMGNHVHVVLAVPAEAPDAETAAARWNAFYAKRKGVHVDAKGDPERCVRIAGQLVDLSQFMRYVNQAFTFHYNRAHRRRGTLWGDRFKSTILEGRQALWNCVKYVELNPVRAQLTEDPAAYRFSSWGWYSGSGSPLFGDAFARYLRRSLGDAAAEWSDEEVMSEFRGELARTLAAERGDEDPHEAKTEAKRGETMAVRFLRRTRHWTDGAIIGSKAFVRETACRFEDRSRVLRRQFSRGRVAVREGTAADALYCLKRLDPSVG